MPLPINRSFLKSLTFMPYLNRDLGDWHRVESVSRSYFWSFMLNYYIAIYYFFFAKKLCFGFHYEVNNLLLLMKDSFLSIDFNVDLYEDGGMVIVLLCSFLKVKPFSTPKVLSCIDFWLVISYLSLGFCVRLIMELKVELFLLSRIPLWCVEGKYFSICFMFFIDWL